MPSPAAALQVRDIDPASDVLDTWMSVKELAFKNPARLTSEQMAFRRSWYDGNRLSAVFEASRLIGTFRSWDTALTVPGGGCITADAVSSVAVLPTHRRRGALSAMMTADLAAAHERGTPVAVLIASQAPIYGRFGFGPATEAVTWTIDALAARLRPGVRREGSLEFVDATTARAAAPAVYTAGRQPGAIDRNDIWWDDVTGTAPYPGVTPPAAVRVLHRDDAGTPQGFLCYHAAERWEGRACRTVVHVDHLEAATPGAYAALWGLLIELDLVASVRAENRWIDEPLPWLLTDRRSAQQAERADFLWTRLLDPVVALTARRYSSVGAAVIEIVDADGWAAGRFALEVSADGATCEHTSRPPDVTLPIQVISGLWLGGGDLHAAALAGDAVQHRPGGIDRVARLLRTTRAPWMSTWF